MEMEIVEHGTHTLTMDQWDDRLSRIAANAARVADEMYDNLVNNRDWDGPSAADLVQSAMPAIVEAVS